MNNIQNSSYKFTLLVPVYNSDTSSKSVSVSCWSSSNTFGSSIISGDTISSSSYKLYSLDITQNASANTVSVQESSGSSTASCLINSSTMPLQISFSSGSAKIRVIFYILKLDIGSSSLRTIYGTATCSTDTDCIEGYSCIGSTCQSY